MPTDSILFLYEFLAAWLYVSWFFFWCIVELVVWWLFFFLWCVCIFLIFLVFNWYILDVGESFGDSIWSGFVVGDLWRIVLMFYSMGIYCLIRRWGAWMIADCVWISDIVSLCNTLESPAIFACSFHAMWLYVCFVQWYFFA